MINENGSEINPSLAERMGLFFAFSPAQRKALVERDGEKCNFPAMHACNGKARLEVHHILSQRYLKNFDINPDFPENAITICQIAHQEIIHEDCKKARRKYQDNPHSYQEMFKERDEKIRRREIFWNPEWDRSLQVLALRNTQRAKENGWVFPEK